MRYLVIQNNNKVRFYKNITKVIKTQRGRIITYTVNYSNGTSFSLSYVDGETFDFVKMYQAEEPNMIGRVKKLSPRPDLRGARTINRENVSIYLNELIYNLDRLASGLPALVGEYNHHYLAIWAGDDEKYSTKAGEVVSREQNNAHKTLALRIAKVTGKHCSVPSYGDVYGLLGININTKAGKQKFKADVNHYISQGLLKEVS